MQPLFSDGALVYVGSIIGTAIILAGTIRAFVEKHRAKNQQAEPRKENKSSPHLSPYKQKATCVHADHCAYAEAQESEINRLQERVVTLTADLRLAHEELGRLRQEVRQLHLELEAIKPKPGDAP